MPANDARKYAGGKFITGVIRRPRRFLGLIHNALPSYLIK
jgi:hypothetical protein